MKELFEFIEAKENFKVADLDFSLVKQIPDWAKGFDLHDRVIFVIGEIYKGIILTRDREIKKIAETIW